MKKLFFIFLILLSFHTTCFSEKQGQARIDSLLAQLPKAKDDTNKVLLICDLSNTYSAINPDEGLKYGQMVLELAEKINWKKGMAKANYRLGVNYFAKLNYPLALEYDLKSLNMFEDLGIKSSLAIVLSNIGNVYQNQTDYPKALDYYLKAVKMYEELGDKTGMARAFHNIGLNYDLQFDYPNALVYYFKAIKISEAVGDKAEVSAVSINIGNIYSNQADYDIALDYYSKALKLNESFGTKESIAGDIMSLGNVYENEHDYPKALEYYLKSLKMFEEVGVRSGGMARDLNNMGVIYKDESDYAKALDYFFKSLKMANEVDDKYPGGMSYAEIGYVYLKIATDDNKELLNRFFGGNKKAALQRSKNYTDSAIFVLKKINAFSEQVYPYKTRSDAMAMLGDYKGAFESYQTYMIVKDSAFNMEKNKKITQLSMQYDFDKKESLTKAEQEKKDAIAEKEVQKQKLVRNGFVGGFAIVLLFAGVFFRQRNKTKAEKKRSDDLLLNILPTEVAEELKTTGAAKAKAYTMVTVMFTDFKDFTSVSEKISAELLVDEIHHCFSAFDNIIQKYKIEKIKTIGDAYLCASGLPVPNLSHAEDMLNAAMEIRDFMLKRKEEAPLGGLGAFELRIGIHTGPVVAGIVGVKKYAYDIWGDTVNLAARMEQNSDAGKINISGSTYELVKTKFKCEHRGKIEAKNKGMIDMYFVEG